MNSKWEVLPSENRKKSEEKNQALEELNRYFNDSAHLKGKDGQTYIYTDKYPLLSGYARYVSELGLTARDLKKSILDIGAGRAEFAKFVRDSGINDNVVNLDLSKAAASHSSEKEQYVLARAEKMPFRNESFELVISNASMPGNGIAILSEEEGEDRVRLEEMWRVLKPGGEIRCAHVPLDESGPREYVSNMLKQALGNFKEKYNAEVEVISPRQAWENDFAKEEGFGETSLLIIRKPRVNQKLKFLGKTPLSRQRG